MTKAARRRCKEQASEVRRAGLAAPVAGMCMVAQPLAADAGHAVAYSEHGRTVNQRQPSQP